ncbi:MAG: family 78 glycoside hydrolase catalytic domain [Clostridia bacterium]
MRLQGKGRAGEQVRVLCGEELQSDGHVRSICEVAAARREIWTLSGQEDELENFDYKALRYVEIETSSSAITPASITLMAQHYPYRNPSVIDQCSEPLLKESGISVPEAFRSEARKYLWTVLEEKRGSI